jgi:hypothetical protein
VGKRKRGKGRLEEGTVWSIRAEFIKKRETETEREKESPFQ